MTTYPIPVPPEVVVWQGHCLHCLARYAVLHAAQDDAPRLSVCPFCGHHATYARREAKS